MSYILDALKKSEQERGHGSVPGVQTIHSSSINYHQNQRTVWPWLLVIAVIINILALLYFIQTRNNSQAVSTEADHVAQIADYSIATSAPHRAPPDIAPRDMNSTAVISSDIDDSEEVIVQKTTEVETVVVKEAEHSSSMVTDLHDLPLNIKQHIPAMTFSAHVYSSNPKQRSLVINGRFMEEGNLLSSELTLVEITPDGAIFDFRGQRFRTSILSGWN